MGERMALGGPAAWRGVELERDGAWIWHLEARDIAAIDAAVDRVRERGLSWAVRLEAIYDTLRIFKG